MADTADQGVVNDQGQVFSSTTGNQVYSTLYVADGAIIPDSVGVRDHFCLSCLGESFVHYFSIS